MCMEEEYLQMKAQTRGTKGKKEIQNHCSR